jgi:hypothetical protein
LALVTHEVLPTLAFAETALVGRSFVRSRLNVCTWRDSVRRPPDVLHFVTYDTEAQTVFTNGNLSEEGKPELVTKIKAVQVGTATNLVAGVGAIAFS